MDQIEALKLVEQILSTRPAYKGFLKSKEETALWVITQMYVRGFEIDFASK